MTDSEHTPSLPRTVILPEFTPEQIAHIDRLMAATRWTPTEEIRIGGPSTLPAPRQRRLDAASSRSPSPRTAHD